MAAPKREDRDPGSIKVVHEDGAVWLLLANLELRLLKPAPRRSRRAAGAQAPQTSLF